MISLDMSEYGEKHTVSRLFGAPPGFVGFEEGGQLTEKVRRKPFSVVLFDEIEKAHPDIFNSLLQILEEGRLTDGQGRVVDFKNTVIIMTTNLGTKDISGGPVGFQIEGDTQTGYDRMRGKVYEELKKNFKPEFLNRVDEIIVFPQLSKPELLQIVDLFIKRLSTRLLDRDMTIELAVPAKERLIEVGFDPTLGARPLRRAVQHEIEDRLSERILHGELNAGDHVHVDFKDGEFVFTTESRTEPIGAGINAGAAIGTGPATPDLAAKTD
jgi:ATP-dependent Clp protease ATP-binding subunit ClpC